MSKLLLVGFATIVLSLFSIAAAQEDARAAWQITNFDINANVQQAERTLSAVAVLTARNIGRAPGSTLTFRISSKAAIKAVTVGGATATFRSVAETRGNLQRVTTTLPATAQPNS